MPTLGNPAEGPAGRPDLKFQRAEGHLRDLNASVDAYRSGGRFWVEQQVGATPNSTELVLRLVTPPPLESWALILGDCIHNLRSALDQLAWELDSAPTTGRGGTSFPIHTSRPTPWPTGTVSRMPALAQSIIEALQPFNEPTVDRIERHPLRTLHALDIVDKHHALIRAASKVAGDTIAGLPFGASIESAIFPPFVDGSRIATVTWPKESPIPSLSADVSFDVVLVDQPWANANVRWILEELLVGWVGREVITPLMKLGRS